MNSRHHRDEQQFQEALDHLKQVVHPQFHAQKTSELTDCDRFMQHVASYYDLPSVTLPYLEKKALLETFKSRCQFLGIGYREIVLEMPQSACDFQGDYVIVDSTSNTIGFLYPFGQHYRYWSTQKNQPIEVKVFPVLGASKKVFQLHRPLPQVKGGIFSLLHTLFSRHYAQLSLVTAVAIILAGFSVVFPLVTGYVLDTLVPYARYGAFYAMMLGLACITLSQFLFSWIQSVLILRMTSQAETVLHSGIWLKLVSVPLSFFRKFDSGDLAYRANGVPRLQQAMGAAQISAILAAIFSVVQLFVMMTIDLKITLILLPVMAVLLGGLTGLLGLMIRDYSNMEVLSGKNLSLVYQLMTGIAKLKVAHRQKRAFSLWAASFAKERLLYKRLSIRRLTLQGIFTVAPFLASLSLFVYVGFSPEVTLTAGTLMIFSSALGQWIGAMLGFCQAVLSAAPVAPVLTRLSPILSQAAESSEGPRSHIDVTGSLEVAKVSFAYPDGTQVLSDVSFKVNPEECVAIVGPSGCGKSTLLRLLLGFDAPTQGAILYEGTPLPEIELSHLRSSFGVVLQKSQLFSGSIYSNMVGSLSYTEEEVWQALEWVALREDIEALPMRLHTLIGDQSSLSGGQRQRLMIARALIHKPKFLFLDEATSALDNETQRQVSQSISALKISRIVIAHRLSTIQYADKILVLDKGSIKESGTYSDLLSQKGLFYELASRQLI